MYCPIVGYFFVLFLLLVICCQGDLHSSFRITSKITNCDIAGLKWFMQNVTLSYHHPKIYMNGDYHVTEDIKGLSAMFLHLERCNDQGHDCEDFQNWRINRFCQMIKWRNQIWSEVFNHIQPSLSCPVKKAIYQVRNASLDVDVIMNWFPDLMKYRWKGLGKILNERDNAVFCGIMEARLHQFRTQDRKTSRKPRN